MLRQTYRFIRAHFLHSLIAESQALPFPPGKPAIEIVGLFYNASGLGESARLCAQQLRDEGYKIRCTSVEDFLFKKKEIPWDFQDDAKEDEIGLRIIHLNPPMIPPYALRVGKRNFSSLYNVGYWAWELEHLPPEWVKSLSYINAIIAPSNFTCETVRHYTNKPVFKVPHAVRIEKTAPDMRAKLGFNDDDFIVTSVFSVQSSLERKNPEGLIAAFTQAFPDTDNAHLVFKVSAASIDKDRLIAMAQNHPRIHFIDDIWPHEDILGLIQTSDIYASLHRSEGFGLAIAEAMILGTPVMATNWSGNTDFCTQENSFLVDYTMINVESTHPDFVRAGMSVWADPDIAHAAYILRAVYEDPTEARQKTALCLSLTNNYFQEKFYGVALSELEGLYHTLNTACKKNIGSVQQ